MKVKTAELTGNALDWAVGVASGLDIRVILQRVVLVTQHGIGATTVTYYAPSTSWATGGEIIERERIRLVPWDRKDGEPMAGCWMAGIYSDTKYETFHTDSPLVSAMQCFVYHKLGLEVTVPDELIT